MRLDEKPSRDLPFEAECDFDDAKDGGMRYFLLAIVDHSLPNNVSLRLFNTGNHELLQRQEHCNDVFKSNRDEQENIKKTIWAIAARLN
jgi:hypothetical protein